eukprot:CAMPEP_0170481036 /NCGR_PEP_ID=MMETSP0208-20121228/1635_1 /TAXON_ID=197538 /ORGANISM="Strombidium inclinatum, Strain S3" /LENGTH=76 /DNA_ID=CAMNT_0010753671 /DNA_START=1205 /DNA_END=1435 /DNA_ORIENTATION=+
MKRTDLEQGWDFNDLRESRDQREDRGHDEEQGKEVEEAKLYNLALLSQLREQIEMFEETYSESRTDQMSPEHDLRP